MFDYRECLVGNIKYLMLMIRGIIDSNVIIVSISIVGIIGVCFINGIG